MNTQEGNVSKQFITFTWLVLIGILFGFMNFFSDGTEEAHRDSVFSGGKQSVYKILYTL